MSKHVYKCLTERIEPSPALIEQTKRKILMKKIKEEYPVKNRTFRTVAITVAAVLLIAGAAFAALNLLTPGDVVSQLGDDTLAAAFDGDTAINIKESVTAGDYIYTLQAIVSGADLTDHPSTRDGEIQTDGTYAVVAIQNADGSPMPDISDEDYQPFIVSPLVKGLAPWRANVWTLGGGASTSVVDGVTYHLMECNDVAIFADRELYLGVSTGHFIDNTTFAYDEQTGEISANADSGEASAVFSLPLDPSMADAERAEQFMNEWINDVPEEGAR